MAKRAARGRPGREAGRRRTARASNGHDGGVSAARASGESLPEEFVARLMHDLGRLEGARLLAALAEPPSRGLRIDSRFGDVIDLTSRLGWSARRLPWSPQGAVLDDAAAATHGSDGGHPASRHPWHDAGVYYLQDPSAMGVVPALDPRPGERILDLAAAPGGKSTYVADRLAGTGLLWSHDIDTKRASSLVGNLERCGVWSAVVSHGPVARLAPLAGTFDRVLLDAPCSGEGMFRKSPDAVAMWSPRRVAEFVTMQAALLDAAAEFLRPGGVLVYSTCTFGAVENESAIAALLARRSDMVPDPLAVDGAAGGLEPHATQAGIANAVARWWPHSHDAEGHFVARLRKEPPVTSPAPRRSVATVAPGAEPSRQDVEAFRLFSATVLGDQPPPSGRLRRFGEWLHLVPEHDVPASLSPRRVGQPMGRRSGDRFVPHHALSRLLPDRDDHAAHVDLPADDPRAAAYLSGAVIEASGPDGWLLVRSAGVPLGWAKAKNGELNNHYPKGLRRT